MAEEKQEIKKMSDADLAGLLSFTGIDHSSEQESSVNTIFSKPIESTTNISLNKSESVSKDKDQNNPPPPVKTQEELDAALNLGTENQNDHEQDSEKKSEKISEIEILNDLVKSGDILLFEAEEGQKEKPLEEYTKKERTELLKANMQRIREEEQSKAPAEFFDALPDKLKYAAKYALDGGTNLEALFMSLAQAVQTENLDVATEAGQEQVIRRWGAATGLNEEEIEEEVTSLKDLPGALEKKAKVYKPKLDAKQQQIVEKQVQEAEIRKTQREANAAKYRETIIKTLSASDLDGIKLTPTLQGKLYNGLANFDKKAVNGQMTNGLGMLLEKYNSIEPNPALIAKVYWLLEDPKAFEAAILARGATEIASDTIKKLKTAESQKSTSSTLDTTQSSNGSRKPFKKPTGNIFART